jgi:2-polyprenyl-3-methyl-5-hydroxy-6-metoxy-1,4-benzoquinol methylase
MMHAAGTSPRLIQHCPVGCDSQLATSAIVLPEGPLLRCAACGQLVSQITTAAWQRSMTAFDSHEFNRPSAAESARRVALARRRLTRAGRLLGKAPGEIRLIDVGCSRGDFVAAAVQLGIHAEGVEPAPQIAAAARAAGLIVHQGLLEEQRFAAASFDVVTLFEVIEHLPAPMALLRECHRILPPDGILIASTGNTASWTVAAMQARWDYFQVAQDAGHVSFFNPRSIALVAARTGFGVEHIGTARVRFVEESAAPRWLYRLGKIVAEFANLPARLLGGGHDMLVYLRRQP